jgi:hypothetical protein
MLKTRNKEVHAAIGRTERKPNSGDWIAMSEHFGLDLIEDASADSALNGLADMAQLVEPGETPYALFHWSVRAFPSSNELPPYLEQRGAVERANEWMGTLESGIEVTVTAGMRFPLSEYRCIVPLPLDIPRERLAGFTDAPGVWLVKREADAASGASLYEVFALQRTTSLELRAEFLTLSKGGTEAVHQLVAAAKQVASFAVTRIGVGATAV